MHCWWKASLSRFLTPSRDHSVQKLHTFALVHLPIDLDEDTSVAESHDKQGEHIQRHKVKHVVCRLLPAMQETSMGHTLSEVHSISFNGPKDEQLRMKSVKMKDEYHAVTEKYKQRLYLFILNKQNKEPCNEGGSLTPCALKSFNATQSVPVIQYQSRYIKVNEAKVDS